MSALIFAAIAIVVGIGLASRYPNAVERSLKRIVFSWRLIGGIAGAVMVFYLFVSGVWYYVLFAAVVTGLGAAYVWRRKQEGDLYDALSR
jgi:uncharacterized membrane protein